MTTRQTEYDINFLRSVKLYITLSKCRAKHKYTIFVVLKNLFNIAIFTNCFWPTCSLQRKARWLLRATASTIVGCHDNGGCRWRHSPYGCKYCDAIFITRCRVLFPVRCRGPWNCRNSSQRDYPLRYGGLKTAQKTRADFQPEYSRFFQLSLFDSNLRS